MNFRTLFALSLVLSLSAPAAFACGEDEGHEAMSSSKHHGGEPSFVMTSAHADEVAAKPGMASATFKIEGMLCASCKKSISASLQKIEGVDGIAFDTKKGMVTVTYATAKVAEPAAAFTQAIAEAGFEAKVAPAAGVKAPAKKGA